MKSANEPIDKSWVDLSDRKTTEYITGISNFLDFAYSNKLPNSKICCPCKKCKNRFFMSQEDVFTHCMLHGFLEGYKKWIYHGESYIRLHETED